MMSSINVLFSMAKSAFEFEAVNLEPTYCDISAGIKKIVDVLSFDGLSFGFNLLDASGAVIVSHLWPEEGVTYLRTDQEILATERVEWKPGATLTLRVWFQNRGRTISGEYEFIVPTESNNSIQGGL